MKHLILAVFLISTSFNVNSIETLDDETEKGWIFGAAITAVTLPHYRGSDQAYSFVLPIPLFLYSGERLKVNRDGGRFILLKSDSFSLDLSAALWFPVSESDNTARGGMPSLAPILELGPAAHWAIWKSKNKAHQWSISAPLRLAINLRNGENTGYTFTPYFHYRHHSIMRTHISIGPMWASERYHDYYYQVDSPYATPERPYYDAQAGNSGLRISITTSHKFDNELIFFAALRVDELSDSVFANSPLVKTDKSLLASISLAYYF